MVRWLLVGGIGMVRELRGAEMVRQLCGGLTCFASQLRGIDTSERRRNTRHLLKQVRQWGKGGRVVHDGRQPDRHSDPTSQLFPLRFLFPVAGPGLAIADSCGALKRLKGAATRENLLKQVWQWENGGRAAEGG
jgi:hypothetical protein